MENLNNLTFRVKNDEVAITKHSGNDEEIVIPTTINSLPVTEIAPHAFCRSKVKRVVVPDGIIIKRRAFEDSDIKEIVGNPEYVEEDAFANTELENKSIGNTIFFMDGSSSIPETAIQVIGKNNTVFHNVVISASVKYITGFNHCLIDWLVILSGKVYGFNHSYIKEIQLGKNIQANTVNFEIDHGIIGDNCKIHALIANNVHLGVNCTIIHLRLANSVFIPTNTKLTSVILPEVFTTNLKVAYKGFSKSKSGLKCEDFIYNVGETYTQEGKLEICRNGFHACLDPLNCLYYYENDQSSVYYEVEILGKLQHLGNKIATNKIKITDHRLSLPEMIEIHNKLINDAISV